MTSAAAAARRAASRGLRASRSVRAAACAPGGCGATSAAVVAAEVHADAYWGAPHAAAWRRERAQRGGGGGGGGVPLAKGNADTVAACALGGPQALDKGEIARARFANDTSGRVLLVYKVRRTTAHLEGGSLSVGVALPLRIWAFWSLERRVF